MMPRVLALLVVLAGCGDNLEVPFGFDKHTLDPVFRSEGVTVFDVDKDGHLDIVTAEQWHAGPTFSRVHDLREPQMWDPTTAYAHGFLVFHHDVDADGYSDIVVSTGPGNKLEWCNNPQGRDEHWPCHPVLDVMAGESPQYVDLFGAGPALLAGVEPGRTLGLLTPGVLDQPWIVQPLSTPDFLPVAQHGLGAVDINGDGKLDVVTGSGWLEQPALPSSAPWPWHPVEICVNSCAHITGFDITGDGLVDLLGASPHGYGTWWFEQVSGGQFVRHDIDDTVSQNHAAQLADLDRDGIPELVTGKRWLAHLSGDPGTDDPVVLVIYKLDRATLTWTRIQVDDDSGVGNQFEIVDVDRDGRLDIVTSTKKGLFWFEQR
jgi:hypothetical protein